MRLDVPNDPEEERDQVDESGDPVLVPLIPWLTLWILKKEFASLMLLYASMHALEPSTEAVSFVFSVYHKNLLLLSSILLDLLRNT